ncbi:MAG: aldehyde ferredoxin oxidoreductase family protein [Nitrososphaerota archaeon]
MEDRSMVPSYGGFILNVDLTNKLVEKKELDEKLCKMFVGGKGFGTKLLYDARIEKADPLSPDNLLIMSIGPGAGTIIPFTSKVNFNFKSPLTGCYGVSQMGGYFAPKLKWAGYDIVIVRGRSENPVYLYIDENGGEIRNADYLWGKTTQETEEILMKELEQKAAVLEIGPAGENLVKFACICHANAWRQAGRTGPGAVMGSKKLKAIAVVSDRKEVAVDNPQTVHELVEEIHKHIREDPVETLAENYRKYGTPRMVEIANELHFFPTGYWRDVYFEKYKKIGPEAMAKYIVSNRTCWNCPFACGKLIEIKEGPYAGTRVEGPEYETIYAFGGLCKIDSIEAIAKINELCDLYGIDTMTMGNVASFAIEAYKLGKLKLEKGVDYSDPEGVIQLIEKVVKREGVGDLLAEGVRYVADTLGLTDLAIESRGLEPAGYDPRSLPGMALAYALSDRGACHLRSVMYAVDMSGKVERFTISSEKVSIYIDNEDRYNVFDCMVLCRFSRQVFTWDKLVKMVKGLTGFNYDINKLKEVSQRIQALSRLFNLKCGSKCSEDTVSKRFMTEAVKVNDRLVTVNEKELRQAINEYYQRRGWDEKGTPKEETLKNLGLTDKTS